jgi:hypothetical protein
MLDQIQAPQPADPQRVNTYEPHEVEYWTKALGVDAERLREVVAQVGPNVEDVRRRLSDSTLAE